MNRRGTTVERRLEPCLLLLIFCALIERIHVGAPMSVSRANKLIALAFPAALVTLGPLACSRTPTPPAELKKSAVECMQNQDYECAEDDWQDYLKQRPADS